MENLIEVMRLLEEQKQATIVIITQAGGTESFSTRHFPHLMRNTRIQEAAVESLAREMLALEDCERKLEKCDTCKASDPEQAGCSGWVVMPQIHAGDISWDAYKCFPAQLRDRRRKYESRVKSARIPARFEGMTLQSFAPTPSTGLGYQRASNYVKSAEWSKGKGLLFVGPVGTGKTHLAVAVLNEALKDRPGIFVTVPDLLEEIKQSYRDEDRPFRTENDLINLIRAVDFLVLDDLGAEKITDRNRGWVQEQLFIVINHRYQHGLSTLVTTNCSMDELEARVGDRITSRLIEMTDGVMLAGQDWRKRKLA